MKYTLILPIYNESGNLKPLINDILTTSKLLTDFQIIAVNDGSKDNSLQELEELKKIYPDQIAIIDHGTNRGFAAALKTGIAAALRTSSDVALFMDADQTHNPKDLIKLIKAIEDGYDFVIGSRYVSGGSMLNVPKYRVYLSQIFNWIIRRILFVNLKDMTSGYRAIKTEALRSFDLKERDFTIQMEEIIKAYKLGFKFREIPITLVNRKIGKSAMQYNIKTFWVYGKLLLKCLVWRLGFFSKNPITKE